MHHLWLRLHCLMAVSQVLTRALRTVFCLHYLKTVLTRYCKQQKGLATPYWCGQHLPWEAWGQGSLTTVRSYRAWRMQRSPTHPRCWWTSHWRDGRKWSTRLCAMPTITVLRYVLPALCVCVCVCVCVKEWNSRFAWCLWNQYHCIHCLLSYSVRVGVMFIWMDRCGCVNLCKGWSVQLCMISVTTIPQHVHATFLFAHLSWST